MNGRRFKRRWPASRNLRSGDGRGIPPSILAGAGAGAAAKQPQVHTPFLLDAQRWINSLVEYETTHPHPAPLNKAEKKVLAELELILAPAPDEPDLSGEDWISLLQREYAPPRVSPHTAPLLPSPYLGHLVASFLHSRKRH